MCVYVLFLSLMSLTYIELQPLGVFDLSLTSLTHVMVCLCWRCTQAGMTSDPDVVLLCWVFWVRGDLILIYYWGGIHLAAPMGGGPCSTVL